jgi:outer membrane protein OmpA-like peptidoglycan-associated protein
MKSKHLPILFYRLIVCLFCLVIPYLSQSQVKSEIGPPFDFETGNEYDPVFSNDGNLFAYISDKSGQFKLYICQFANGQWSIPQEISSINQFNNGMGNIRNPAFNFDSRVLYFSADFYKDSSNVDIFYSENVNGKWSEPKSIGAPVNTIAYDGQPSISPDDRALYFVRNTKSSQFPNADCKKVMVSYRQEDGSWMSPRELPIPINVDCEQLPRIAIDNKTLYFASIRDGGKGGFDIYKTKLLAKNVWIPAETIDTLNDLDNEYTPALFFNSNEVFYSIEKSERRTTSTKLFKNTLAPQFLPENVVKFDGKIIDRATNKPLQADIFVYDPVTSRLLLKFMNNPENGDFLFFLPTGENYLIDFHKPGYSHTYVNIDAARINKNELITKNIVLYKDISLILNVLDKDIFKPLNAKIQIRNSNNELVNCQIEPIKTGRYNLKIPLGDKYMISTEAEYFDPQNFDFDLTGIVLFDEFERDIELASRKVDFQIDIADEDSEAGIAVEIIITNLESNEVIRTTAISSGDGKYIVKLREGDRYSVSVSPKGYSYYNTTVDLKKSEAPKKLEVKLKQLKEDTKLTLKNITFEFNSADLNLNSFEELDRVVKLLTDNPTIKIEVSAHTDNKGSDNYNLRLSKRRAKSVMDYLVEKGIDGNRIISQGYGKTKPLVPNDSEENMALNRRVELKIIKID